MPVIDPIAVLLILVGSLYLLMSGVVLKRRSIREWPVIVLIVYLALSFLWILGHAFLLLNWTTLVPAETLWQVLLYETVLLSLLFFHLSWSFLQLEGTDWRWWALGLVWALTLIVLGLNLFNLPPVLWYGNGWSLQRQELVNGLAIIGWSLFMGSAAWLTLRAYRQTQQPLHKNRIAYWTLALILTVISFSLSSINSSILAIIINGLSALIVIYAIAIYNLPDMRRIMRRTVSYVIITLLTIITYTGGFLLTQYIFQSVPGYNPIIAGATMALILAILFDPFLSLLQRLVNRLITGNSYDTSRTLREYSMNISNILDLERLAAVVMDLIGEVMPIKRGLLFVVHRDQEEIQLIQEHGEAEIVKTQRLDAPQNGSIHLRGIVNEEEGVISETISADNPVVVYLRHERQPLTQYDIDLLPRFKKMLPAERTWLAGLGMDVYVPIYAKGEWIGLLALGPKLSGDSYFESDLVLLTTLADQTAVAFENARLFDDLKVRNTENERLNQELLELNQKLARLDRVKTEFIHIASHELRTPLTQILGYNDILREMMEAGPIPPAMATQLTTGVKKASHRLQEIIDAMFDVSQIDTETLSLSLGPTSLSAVIDEATRLWTSGFEERKQTLVVEGLEELPSLIADGGQLVKTFSQLIQNAIKYTPDGGKIEIRGSLLSKEITPEEQIVEVVVSDNGIGIAPENLETIFEKFHRAGSSLLHSTGKTKFKGAGPGLGLTIAKGIVQAHGGRIWAESPGYDEESCPGSTFHVVLPVQSRTLEIKDSVSLIPALKASEEQVQELA
jgi:signal transduction histidine kinase